MAQTEPFCSSLLPETAHGRCAAIRSQLRAVNLLADPSTPPPQGNAAFLHSATSWRTSPTPFLLTRDQLDFFTELGPHLLAFYGALNRLYHESVKGAQPAWVAGWLDQGKPDALLNYSRMKRWRDALPLVIRPDVIPTQDGMVITELDSVPGGIGLTAAMSRAYEEIDRHASAVDRKSGASHQLPAVGAESWISEPRSARLPLPPYEIIGGGDGMVRGFASMLKSAQERRPGCVAILVSEEARDYRPELSWLASELRGQGISAWCVQPPEVRFTEEGLTLKTDIGEQTVGLIYRFYELFDLLNIPKAELIQYAAKKDRVAITPPYKPALEEKSAFALLHHPVLRPFWELELGKDRLLHLTTIIPRTWLLDPAPIAATATIPGLYLGGRAVSDWADLAKATQKERHFVVKPSGFSELAWGSRGVSIGHDLPQAEWTEVLRKALTSFSTVPYVLQEFHKGRLIEISYLDEETPTMVRMAGRARLSPYYFVTGETVQLAGILATICPADKKIIHGMKDAVMAPCAVTQGGPR